MNVSLEGKIALGGLLLLSAWLFVALPFLTLNREPNFTSKIVAIDTAASQIQPLDKIQILFHEYDTLRTEVLQRYAASFQAIGVIALVLMGLVTILATGREKIEVADSLRSRDRILYVLMVVSVTIFGFIMLWIDSDTTRAACRLRQLEREINVRGGETLLKWETLWGSGGGLVGKNFYYCPN